MIYLDAAGMGLKEWCLERRGTGLIECRRGRVSKVRRDPFLPA